MKKRNEQQFQPTVYITTEHDRMLKNLAAVKSAIYSEDSAQQLEGVFQFKECYSIDGKGPVQEVVQSGVLSRFVEFLAKDDYLQLQYETLWALTMFTTDTSENHTKALIDNGAVPALVRLLSSPIDYVREQAVWALGNIAGQSPESRDFVLGCHALLPLLAQFHYRPGLSTVQGATWTLKNFCSGHPEPKFDLDFPVVHALASLIVKEDEEIIRDACLGLSFLAASTSRPLKRIQALIDADLCPRLVELLQHSSTWILIPVMSTIGNITAGSDFQTQRIIDCGVLPHLLTILTNNDTKSTMISACAIIENINAGNEEQIQAVIDTGTISALVTLIQNVEFKVKKEASWAIAVATIFGTNNQIKYLAHNGCIKPICDLLVCSEPKIIEGCLEALESILMVGEAEKNNQDNDGNVNVFSQMIKDAEGLKKIENLQTHDNKEIYEKAVKIVKTYFSADEQSHFTGGLQ